MSAQRDEAIVLHVRPYADHDAIVSLFAKQHGRVSVFSRGLRSKATKSKVALMPSYQIEVELWRKPGSELWSARVLTLLRAHPNLSSDLLRLGCANAALEAVRECFQDGEIEAQIYDDLAALLGALSLRPPLETLVEFEASLLDALGFGEGSRDGDAKQRFMQHSKRFSSIRSRSWPAREFLTPLL